MIKLTTTVPKRKDLLSKRAKTENVSVKRLKQIKPLSPILDALTGYKKEIHLDPKTTLMIICTAQFFENELITRPTSLFLKRFTRKTKKPELCMYVIVELILNQHQIENMF